MKFNVVGNVKLDLNRSLMKTETFRGEKYLVVPAVILTEGVHNGSAGPIFYPGEELAKFPAAWNGRPLTLDHPVDANGTPVSANSPAVLSSVGMGFLSGTRYKENPPRLCSELWVNVEEARRVSPETLALLNNSNGKPNLEISTGVFFDPDETPGNFNGEAYDGIARNMRSDHLALLPGGLGACSIADGCGAPRMNQDSRKVDITSFDSMKSYGEYLNSQKDLTDNEKSLRDVVMQVRNYVDSLDQLDRPGGSIINYVEDVFEDYFVFRRESPEGMKLYRQNYIVQESGEIKVSEEVVEVRKNVTFAEVQNENKEALEMNKVKVIDALLTNEQSPFCCDSEKGGDKSYLEGLSDDRLMRHAQKYGINEEGEQAAEEPEGSAGTGQASPAGDPPVEPGAGQQVTELSQNSAQEPKKGPATLQEFMEGAPAELRGPLTAMKDHHDKWREGLVSSVLASKKNKFTEPELVAMEDKVLENLAIMASGDEQKGSYQGGRHGAVPTSLNSKVANSTPLGVPTLDEQ